MRFRLVVGLVMLLVAAGCSAGGSGSPKTSTTAITGPTFPDDYETLLDDYQPPPPLLVEPVDVDFGDLRKFVGTWELVSFPFRPVPSRVPTLTFGYLRTNETGVTYDLSQEGLCQRKWGSYTVAGNQIRASASGNWALEIGCDDEYADLVFSLWLSQAETWSVEGELLTINSVDDVTGVFRRVVEFPSPQLVDDDGLETVAPRLHFVDESGFLVLIQEQEDADGLHSSENLNWLAWTPGSADGWRTESLVSPNSWDFYRNLRDSFVAVEYPDSLDEPCLLADMNSLHGVNTASIRHRRTASGAELLVDEEGSSSAETGHTDERLGVLVADCSGEASTSLKIGRVDGATDEWTRVDFGQLVLDPVVVAGPASLNGTDPGVVEVRNVTSLSFEIRFHEWDYLDGIHPTGETISYIVAQRGVTVLPSGAHIEAGTVSANPTMTEVLFESPFSDTPVVISTVLR